MLLVHGCDPSRMYQLIFLEAQFGMSHNSITPCCVPLYQSCDQSRSSVQIAHPEDPFPVPCPCFGPEIFLQDEEVIAR
jgi:hypothetical protein